MDENPGGGGEQTKLLIGRKTTFYWELSLAYVNLH